MADVIVDGEHLVLRLTASEKAEAQHGDVRVPLTSVTSVGVLDDAIGAVHGLRSGAGVPGVVVAGTVTSQDTKIFAVVHHDTHRGVRVTLKDASFDQLIVGCGDPEEVASRLAGAIPATPQGSGQRRYSGRGRGLLGSVLYRAVFPAVAVALVLLLHDGMLNLAIVIVAILAIIVLRVLRS